MEKRLLTALLVLLLYGFSGFSGISGPAAAPENSMTRCLVIGMDAFVSEENTAPCSANNAETLAALLGACLPEGTRVTRSINGPGSVSEMETLILDVFRGARENDVSWICLSTHGVRWEEPDGETRMAWILSDGTREEALEPEELRRIASRVPGKKVLVLDCCHAGAALAAFTGPEWRVLAGCGPEEECFFWAAGEETGMGYFTSALESAMRASDPAQIDPDGDGQVSLRELAARMREVYGISTARFQPEEDGSPLLFLPKEQPAQERLLGLKADPPEKAGGALTISFDFRTETAVKLEYRLVPAGAHGWEFNSAVRIPDRERTGQRRGVLSPGEKHRTIRVTAERLGESGKALLQLVSYRGLYGQVPVPEMTYVICGDCE